MVSAIFAIILLIIMKIGPKFKIYNELRKNSLDDWKLALEKIKQNQKKQQYDCVIGYSGGKDSTALFYKFIYEYKIRPLAITIDTGFMTDVAKKNIRKTLKKIDMINIILFFPF